MVIARATLEQSGPLLPNPELHIQTIEFKYTHDKNINQAINTKTNKYNPLIIAIKAKGWNINLLEVITTGVGGAIHSHNIDKLKSLHIPIPHIKKCMKNSHQLVIKCLTYLVLNKQKLDNKQAPVLPQPTKR